MLSLVRFLPRFSLAKAEPVLGACYQAFDVGSVRPKHQGCNQQGEGPQWADLSDTDREQQQEAGGQEAAHRNHPRGGHNHHENQQHWQHPNLEQSNRHATTGGYALATLELEPGREGVAQDTAEAHQHRQASIPGWRD